MSPTLAGLHCKDVCVYLLVAIYHNFYSYIFYEALNVLVYSVAIGIDSRRL